MQCIRRDQTASAPHTALAITLPSPLTLPLAAGLPPTSTSTQPNPTQPLPTAPHPCPHHHHPYPYPGPSPHPLCSPHPPTPPHPQVQKYEVRRHALFFTDPSCRAMYRAHVAALAGRRNSVTGQLYRDDPTIMAWDLINEPRCESWAVADCPQLLQVRGLAAAAGMP